MCYLNEIQKLGTQIKRIHASKNKNNIKWNRNQIEHNDDGTHTQYYMNRIELYRKQQTNYPCYCHSFAPFSIKRIRLSYFNFYRTKSNKK